MAYADCKLRSSPVFAAQFESWLKTRDVLAGPCYAMSLLAGILIMRQIKSRSPYPNLFIAYICFCQAGSIAGTFFSDYNFCESPLTYFFLNTILNKDSYLSSQLGGFYLFDISHW